MVSVHKNDRDSLRFLWAADPAVQPTDIVQFTRVVFGVSSSPSLLKATINHHLETYHQGDPAFVDKLLSSIYVDDLVSGLSGIPVKSKLRLATAWFKLRKFVTNSEELRQLIREESSSRGVEMGEPAHAEQPTPRAHWDPRQRKTRK